MLLVTTLSLPVVDAAAQPVSGDHAASAEVEATPSASGGKKKKKAKKERKKIRLRNDDGDFDASEALEESGAFLPLVIPITEPAVGFGALGALAFFHNFPKWKDGTRKVPDSITAVIGGGTANGTWAAGVGHFGFYLRDTVRYSGIAAYADVNLPWYGNAGTSEPIRFRPQGFITNHQALFRIASTPLFLGLKYSLSILEVTSDADSSLPELKEGPDILSSLELVAMYDDRDSVFTADKGVHVRLSGRWNAPWLGSNYNYGKANLKLFGYWPLHPRWVLGGYADAAITFGSAPFYTRPFVRLRGVPAVRYQGDFSVSAEAELRWDFVDRWSWVFIGGVGAAVNNQGALLGGQLAYGGGVGFRYLLAEKNRLRIGVDVARGPETFAVYIVLGSYWAAP